MTYAIIFNQWRFTKVAKTDTGGQALGVGGGIAIGALLAYLLGISA